MINLLKKKATTRLVQRELVYFDSSYINKFDLALRNLDMVMQEESGYSVIKKKTRKK